MKFTYMLAISILGVAVSKCGSPATKEAPMTGFFVDTMDDEKSLMVRTVTISQAGTEGTGGYSVKIHSVERFKDTEDNVDKVTDRAWIGYYNATTSAIHADNQLDVLLVPDSGYIRINQVAFYPVR
ncbi:hypothetical protein [Chitinophaga barathri]|uniref:Uncharacterized protein n=1 Tax=Chitinophaga barathri TaxID=1647451 RepID=A0A3N4N631_9BACT|nr:hypothetical protein [Chitinophaga barathri]RPD43093.1 hypothetical protein EG028_02020 [Chitinophaga barathri]